MLTKLSIDCCLCICSRFLCCRMVCTHSPFTKLLLYTPHAAYPYTYTGSGILIYELLFYFLSSFFFIWLWELALRMIFFFTHLNCTHTLRYKYIAMLAFVWYSRMQPDHMHIFRIGRWSHFTALIVMIDSFICAARSRV